MMPPRTYALCIALLVSATIWLTDTMANAQTTAPKLPPPSSLGKEPTLPWTTPPAFAEPKPATPKNGRLPAIEFEELPYPEAANGTSEFIAAPEPAQDVPVLDLEKELFNLDEIPLFENWEGSVELGSNGSVGNNERFNLYLGAAARWRTPSTILTLITAYWFASQQQVDTANRLFSDGRNEWLLANSPWLWYVHGTVEFDQFRAFDSRVSSDTGIGYWFYQAPTGFLVGRFGSGVAHEFGGPDESYVPEGVFGVGVEHRLSKRQRFNATSEAYFDWTDWGQYRVNTKGSWQLDLDSSSNLSMKVSVIDRYDSTPNGAIANDLDYVVALLWSF